MNPSQVLQWLARHAVELKIQELSPDQRMKNSVILTFRRSSDLTTHTVGYSSIGGAVAKANVILLNKSTAAIADDF